MATTVTALDCGWMRTQQRTLSQGGSHDEFSIPIPSWLVQHPRGTVVFDVGLHADLAHDPETLGDMAKRFTPELEHGGTVAHRLAEHDVDPLGALTVVLSHCHFDHVGGLSELPNARVVIQSNEWTEMLDAGGYERELCDLGHDLVAIDGAHDLFDDGTVTCIPTPGHTCGHQSLRVVTANGPVILAADACYFARTLDDGVLPPFGFDFDQQRASLDMLRREQAAGTAIVPGHDADVFRRMLVTAF